MNKKEEFKKFIKDNPYLGKSVRDGKTTFQKLFEIYDIYGNDEDMFKEYKIKEEKKDKDSISNIISSIKNINLNEVKKNIESLQSAVSFIEDFVVNKGEKDIVEPVINPKPLEGLFDD